MKKFLLRFFGAIRKRWHKAYGICLLWSPGGCLADFQIKTISNFLFYKIYVKSSQNLLENF